MKQVHSLLLVCFATALAALSRADVPDLTSSLEYVANPATNRWPLNAYPRGVLDLQFFRGKLYSGGGETESNPGPMYIYSVDPDTLEEKYEYTAGTEAIARFRISSWGEMYASAQDPHEAGPNTGHVFVCDEDGMWRMHSSIGGTTSYAAGSTKGSVYVNTHTWDMVEFGGRVFSAGYDFEWSTNKFKTFTNTSSITNAYRLLYYVDSSGGHAKWSLRRQVQLLGFESDLYVVPNTLVQPNYAVSDSNKWYNKFEILKYDPDTDKFVDSRIPISTLFPNISSNDYRMVLKDVPTGTYDMTFLRLWHTTPFNGRVLYVGSYDTQQTSGDIKLTSYPLPMMGCSAKVTKTTIWGTTTTTLSSNRISFDGDTEEYPWDFAVVGDVCYALTSKGDATTKIYRHSVWKTTDGVNFSRVLSFDFHQNMISLDYRDGWFWFGVGLKTATGGYAKDSQADESGAIYRVRMPMEPTSVEAVDAASSITEGGSATVGFRLTAQPASNMVLKVAADATQDVSLDKTTLTFTTANWNVAQSVTVSLADDDTADDSKIAVTCGADSYDIERGAFASPEVTSATVFLGPIENEEPATVSSEALATVPESCTYNATFDSLGSVNGVASSSATVVLRVYSDSALATLVGEAYKTVTETGASQSVSVSGLGRGIWYWVVAETTTAPGVTRTFTTRFLSPIGTEAQLVDLMDDEENRDLTLSNATSGGSAGQGAYDNASANFGGYNKPAWLIYQFKTPVPVDGFGIKAMASGDPDRHPQTINIYGGTSTNKSDLVLLTTVTESDWSYGEWRRWVVPNETYYPCYKFEMSAINQHAYIEELELYSIALMERRILPTDPTTFDTLSYETTTSGDSTLRVYRDLAYGRRGDAEGEGEEYTAHNWGYHNHRSGTYFDIYADDALMSSAAARSKMPVFVYLHGGSWSQCYDKDGSGIDLLKRVAAAGYFVVTMDYQLQSDLTENGETTERDDATFADMLADVDTMMTYLKTALPTIGLPTDKIVIGGESAGAHLAMCYAWDQDGEGLQGVDLRHDLTVSCVMSAVGPSNLADETMLGPMLAAATSSDPVLSAYGAGFITLFGWLSGSDLSTMIANGQTQEALAVMAGWSPLNLVNESSCHAILAYGCTNETVSAYASDGIVPVSTYTALTNSLTAASVDHDAQLFMLPDGMNHGNISWNYEPSVSWIVERLTAFKTQHLDDPPPVLPSGRTDFAKYIELTLARDLHLADNTAVSNIPALVRITESIEGFSYSDFQLEGGADLMFADSDGNAIPHEIDTWDESGESLVWVKLPSSAQGSKIVMLWGRGGSSPAKSIALWSDYAGVWHLNETNGADVASGNYGNFPNSTASEGIDGEMAEASVADEEGKFGKSVKICDATAGGTGCSLGGVFVNDAGTSSPLDLGNTFVISGWFKHKNQSYYWDKMFAKRLKSNNSSTPNGAFSVEIGNNGSSHNVTAFGSSSTTKKITLASTLKDEWSLMTFVYSGPTCSIYQNGALCGSHSITEVTDNDARLCFGNVTAGYGTGAGDAAWCGWIDEVRLAGGAPDANAVAAEYNAMNIGDTDIFAFGAAETIAAALTPPVFRSAADGGALEFSAEGFQMHLVDCDESLYYAPFTNGVLSGAFVAAKAGVKCGADGSLALAVDSDAPTMFISVGVSAEPIKVGDVYYPFAQE